MAKRIVAKTGSFTNQQNEVKGEYTKLGVLLTNDNGDYMLMDPCVNLAGVLLKQNALAAKTGGQQRDMVMISIFDDDNQQQQSNQGQQQQAQGGFQQNNQQQQQNGGFNNQGQQQQNSHNFNNQN
jgi:hypothetical protein